MTGTPGGKHTEQLKLAAVGYVVDRISDGMTPSQAKRASRERYGVSEASLRRWAHAQGRSLTTRVTLSPEAQITRAALGRQVYSLDRQRQLVNELFAEVDEHTQAMYVAIAKNGGERDAESATQLSRISVVLGRAITADKELDRRGAPLLAPGEQRPMLRAIEQAAGIIEGETLDLTTIDRELVNAGLLVTPTDPLPSEASEHLNDAVQPLDGSHNDDASLPDPSPDGGLMDELEPTDAQAVARRLAAAAQREAVERADEVLGATAREGVDEYAPESGV